ncbi:Cif family virulence factor [Mucilaginibacter polytrichastri]|uniref:SnoaL-like domain-containing protein n=1 Tax=Mucilaginibacter polytrichastri TaxID=1302689 RepID=A0A1Q6A2Z1_9SPHI|nr:isomerase [Mucilaginibacter polytrichastri]OKS88368.1 hypothetical protein RG47T_3834 [Mucilaginibacter polytrichastri]SFT14090.1 hypothetical protein SAMN04487890_112100 [Mucilaginibacter polytrichastri]
MILSVEEMIKQYVAAWNNNGPEEFKAAFAPVWAADAIYTDPDYALVKGVDGIAGLAQISLEHVPTRTFHVLTQPEHHNNVGRYTWKVILPEETKQGFDYFEFNEAHQITRIVSFF